MPATSSAVLRVIAIASLAHTIFVSARVSAAIYAVKQHNSPFWVGALMALFAIVPMLIAVRTGRWIDRAGPRIPMASALGLLLLGSAVPAFAAHSSDLLAELIASSILIGTGQMFALICVQQWLGEQAHAHERMTHFSWLALAIALAGIAGPLVSGAVIDTLGYRAIYQTLMLATLIATVLLWHSRKLLPHRRGSSQSAISKPAFDLLGHAPLRKILLVAILVSMSWDLQSVMVPLHSDAAGLPAVSVGFILSSFSTATLVVRAAMPWLSQRLWPAHILCLSLANTAVAFALFPMLTNLGGLMILAFLLGLGLGAAQPGLMSLLYERTPAGRNAESLGLRTTLMNSAHVVLPLVLGLSAGSLGHRAIFWSMTLLLALGAVSAWRALRPAPGASPSNT